MWLADRQLRLSMPDFVPAWLNDIEYLCQLLLESTGSESAVVAVYLVKGYEE